MLLSTEGKILLSESELDDIESAAIQTGLNFSLTFLSKTVPYSSELVVDVGKVTVTCKSSGIAKTYQIDYPNTVTPDIVQDITDGHFSKSS